jgi:hypothetical protein
MMNKLRDFAVRLIFHQKSTRNSLIANTSWRIKPILSMPIKAAFTGFSLKSLMWFLGLELIYAFSFNLLLVMVWSIILFSTGYDHHNTALDFLVVSMMNIPSDLSTVYNTVISLVQPNHFDWIGWTLKGTACYSLIVLNTIWTHKSELVATWMQLNPDTFVRIFAFATGVWLLYAVLPLAKLIALLMLLVPSRTDWILESPLLDGLIITSLWFISYIPNWIIRPVDLGIKGLQMI